MINSCTGYYSVPGPLQTDQRAELWEVVLALQASDASHLGVDNLNVVRHVCRLLDGVRSVCPAELVNDGVFRLLELRGKDTVRVTKVKWHADAEMVQAGQVRELDMRLMRLLPLDAVGLIILPVMPIVTVIFDKLCDAFFACAKDVFFFECRAVAVELVTGRDERAHGAAQLASARRLGDVRRHRSHVQL